jgi:hypothetical protein
MNINEYLMSQRDLTDLDVINDYSFPCVPRVVCRDGFSISVQASHSAYCTPRTNVGPWSHVECGFPSDVAVEILSYAESLDEPRDTVYGYVPVELVDQLIANHGGMVTIVRD